MSHCVTYRTVWEHPEDNTLGRPQDIRGPPQGIPWRYIDDHMGTSIGRLLRTSSGCPQEVILPSGTGLYEHNQHKSVFKVFINNDLIA